MLLMQYKMYCKKHLTLVLLFLCRELLYNFFDNIMCVEMLRVSVTGYTCLVSADNTLFFILLIWHWFFISYTHYDTFVIIN